MSIPDTTVVAPSPRASRPARIAAAVAAVLLLGLGTVFTLGAALVGALAVAIANWWEHRRGRPATLFRTWIGACAAATIAIVMAIAFATLRAPAGTVTKEMSAARDSMANQPPREPPAWMRRMPGNRARNPAVDSQVARVTQSPVFVGYMMVIMVGLASALLGTVTGSVGWFGATLLLFGVRGSWRDPQTHSAGSGSLPAP